MSQEYDNFRFLEAARDGDVSNLLYQLHLGANINFQDPKTGATALHYVVARQIRGIIKQLIRFENLDFLVRDHKGRLPSDLAYEIANDPVTGRYLIAKEIYQAKQRGIDYKALITGKESPRVRVDTLT